MRGKMLKLSGGDGLYVMVAAEAAALDYSMVNIYVDSDKSSEAVGICEAIAVFVSSARLRLILCHTPYGETLASDISKQGGLQVSIKNTALVRRVAEEMRDTPYTDGSLTLFLHGKVIELLVAGLWGKGQDNAQSIAEVARDLLLADPLRSPKVPDLAFMLGVTPRKLCNLFKADFGMTVSEWLTDQRLVRAKELVVGGSIPLAEIASLSGFAHLSNFTIAFSKRFGQPPARMRSSNRQLDRIQVISRALNAKSNIPAAADDLPAVNINALRTWE